jgi:hypothetical protein
MSGWSPGRNHPPATTSRIAVCLLALGLLAAVIAAVARANLDALIAARLGHADQGQLVASTYATDTRRERLRAALAAIAEEGGIDAALARAALEEK